MIYIIAWYIYNLYIIYYMLQDIYHTDLSYLVHNNLRSDFIKEIKLTDDQYL